MESINELKMTEREQALIHWLQTDCAMPSVTLKPLPGDASFRRYFRLESPAASFIVMDAPPAQENCQPFVAIAKALRGLGLNTPDIIKANLQQGFLLLTDFGDVTYLKALTHDNADQLYQRALLALAELQRCRTVSDWTVPLFTRDFMWQEWAWHKEWFKDKLLGLTTTTIEQDLDACMALIIESAVSQPQVFMHRDYHSANLMVLPEGDVGILDFQDAFIGPVTYDVVSLLRDCYIDWPEQRVNVWALSYRDMLQAQGLLLDVSEETFLRWFDWMGLQRHLKALLTFARKQVRDQQSHYLKHIPRTLNYLSQTSQRYPELVALHAYLQQATTLCAR